MLSDYDLGRAERIVAAVHGREGADDRLVAARRARCACITWSGAGVLGPEAFDAVPFLDLLRDGHGSPWGPREQKPSQG